VISWFRKFAFKSGQLVYHYTKSLILNLEGLGLRHHMAITAAEVGLCTLNQVEPITHNL
jgi:hypothetical protein